MRRCPLLGCSSRAIDTAGLRMLARGADVLVSEVMDKNFALEAACAFDRLGGERNAAILLDVRTYHIGVDELAQVSADAGVKTLVLTHQVPVAPAAQAETLFRGPIAEVFDGEIVVAEDGTRVTLKVE